MGMQVSCGVHPEVSTQGDVWVDTQRTWADHAGVSITEREREVEEGHLMGDHVHMMLSIPPKYSVSGVVGYIKGKSAIAIARRFMYRTKNFVGLYFWARCYYVSTVGRDESQVRNYIREQEKEDRRLDQVKMFE